MRSRSMNSILFKKSKHFKSILTILGGVFLCIVLLAGCKNFLNAGEVKNQIEDSIAYANAQSCKIYLKSDSTMGSFLSEGEVECKVGYTVDIQFTLNKDDWCFDTLEAVSTADTAESRQDYVQFTLNEKKSDKSKGVYVITVKLLKPAGDILIKPKCLPLPYVTSYTPNTKNAQFANTPVVINFNIPIEDSETSADDSLINYDNILLTFDKPGDMKDYFFPPELNEDKTVLKLVPNAARLKNYIADELKASFVDITISLSDRIIVKNGEQEFPLRQDSNSTFTVRFGTESEETPPDERDFFVSGYEIKLETASDFADEKKLVPDILSANLRIDDCKKNMIPSTIYIYGKYYDKDSGVRSIEVTEKYQGSYALNTTTYKNNDLITNSYDLDSDNVVYVSENGYTTFILQYTIQATLTEEVGGGFFDLSFTIKDACDNPSESKVLAVLCMDYGDLTNLYVKNKENPTLNQGGWLQPNINVTNAVFSKAVEGSAGIYDFSKYNEDIKKIIIKDDKVRSDYHRPYYLIENKLYQELELYCSEVKYVCEYIDRFGKKQRKPFTDYNADTLERSVVLDIDSVTGKSFTVIPMYNNAPLGRKTFYYPSVPLVKSIKTDQVDMYFSESSEEYNYFANCIGICQYPDNSYKIIFGASAVFLNNPGFKVSNSNCKIYLGYLAPNYTGVYSGSSSGYQSQAIVYYDWVLGTDYYEKKSHQVDNGLTYTGNPTNDSIAFGLLGDMVGPFEYGQSAVAALTQPKIEGYTISKSQNKGYVDVTFKFASDIWNKYDSMTITNESSSPEKTYNFTKNDTFVDGENVSKYKRSSAFDS